MFATLTSDFTSADIRAVFFLGVIMPNGFSRCCPSGNVMLSIQEPEPIDEEMQSRLEDLRELENDDRRQNGKSRNSNT